MAYREQTGWASLLAMVIASLLFIAWIAKVGADVPASEQIIMAAATLGVGIFVQIIITIIQAVRSARLGQEIENGTPDERDALFEMRSMRVGYYALLLILLWTMWEIWLGVSTSRIASSLIFAIMLSEVVRIAAQLYYYRRGY
jgi:hypothetical protein